MIGPSLVDFVVQFNISCKLIEGICGARALNLELGRIDWKILGPV